MGKSAHTREMKLLLTIFGCLNAKYSFGGKCPKVPVIQDFDLARYAGVWYEINRYPNSFQDKNGKCVTATYGAIDDVTVSVNNSQISLTRRGKWESGGIMGKAVQTDPEETIEQYRYGPG